MAPLLWCPDMSLLCCSAIPGCSPGPRKSTTNCKQTAVHPLVLLTFGPLRRCRDGTGIVAVELAADPLVVMVFRRLRCCQDDQHVDCMSPKSVCMLILYVEAMGHFLRQSCTAAPHVLPYDDAPNRLHTIHSRAQRLQVPKGCKKRAKPCILA